MARRPAKPTKGFLDAIFHPKSAKPAKGLRRSSATPNKLRKPARVRAFNKLDTLKQNIIVKSGNKEAYLRGSVTLAEAKQQLRPQAIAVGVAKPFTPNSAAVAAIISAAQQRPMLDKNGKLKSAIDIGTVRRSVARMTQKQKRRVETVSTYDELYELIWDEDMLDDEGEPLIRYK